MKRLFTILLFICTRVNSQVECYSALKYEYIDGKSDGLISQNGEIGMCYSSSYFSIYLGNKIETFPVMPESITRDKTSKGYLTYSFMNDETFLYKRGYWSIEIVYEKNRVVVLNNTIGGQAYIITFKGANYHQIKIETKMDSLSEVDREEDSLKNVQKEEIRMKHRQDAELAQENKKNELENNDPKESPVKKDPIADAIASHPNKKSNKPGTFLIVLLKLFGL